MSSNITEAITNAQSRISSVYDTLLTHGATIPATKNTTNLPDAVDSCFSHTEWTPVQYIQASGTQYIDTGINSTTGLRINLDLITVNDTSKVYYGTVNQMVGGGCWFGRMNNNKFVGGILSANYVYSLTSNTEYTIQQTLSGPLVVNGVELASYSCSPSSEGPFYLFAFYDINSGGLDANGPGSYKVTSLKMYENSVLARNFVPCILKTSITADKDSQSTARSAGEIGMWDTVTDKFYGNAGTGTFVAG